MCEVLKVASSHGSSPSQCPGRQDGIRNPRIQRNDSEPKCWQLDSPETSNRHLASICRYNRRCTEGPHAAAHRVNGASAAPYKRSAPWLPCAVVFGAPGPRTKLNRGAQWLQPSWHAAGGRRNRLVQILAAWLCGFAWILL